MQTQTSKERFFSIELNSKTNIRKINLTNGTQENALIEGTIGELVRAVFNEGIILEVVGKDGILRIELSENELKESIAANESLPQNKMATN